MRRTTQQPRFPRSRRAPPCVAVLGLAALSAVSLVSTLTHADGPARFELVYETPAGCPSRQRFAEELRYRTSKIALDDASELRGTIALRVVEQRGRFAGTLDLTVDGATESRSLAGPRCESVVSALGLAAAVLVDPAANAAPLPPTLPAAPPTPASDAGAEEDAPPEAEAPPPAPDASARTEAPPPSPAPEEPARLTWSAEVSAGATTAIHDVDPIVIVGANVERRRARSRLWAAHLRASASLEKDVSATAGTVAYRAYGARLDGCPLVGSLASLDLDLDACAFVSMLLVPVSAPRAPVEHAQLRVLVSPGAVGRAHLRLGGTFGVALDLGVGLHPVQEQFLIEPRGEVFRVPRVYTFGALGLVVTFP